MVGLIGTRVERNEDPLLLTVGGKYVDDLAPADALHVTFVRSTMAHARITVDTSDAADADGVVGVFTATDLELTPFPPDMPLLNQQMLRTHLATDTVRFVGEPIAVVVTDDRAAGVDAAELVVVDYDPLPAVVDPGSSIGADPVFPEAGTNVVFALPFAEPEQNPMDDCEVTVSLSFRNQRLAPCPLEPRSTAASWDGERLTQWSTTQGAHGTRDAVARHTGLDPEAVRIICPDVGGGFGAKNGGYPEDIVVAMLAMRLDRPMRWAETRTESMLGLVHGRGQDFEATLGGDRAGNLSVYRLHITQDAGAYPAIGAVLPFITAQMATGVYDIPTMQFSSNSVITNTVPMGAYRGAGRPEAAAAIERMIDLYANEIGMDPAEVRRRNAWPDDAFPLTTSAGANMDTGAYTTVLDRALAEADYAGLRARQAERRDAGDGPLLGIGMSLYVEITNPMSNEEYGSMTVHPDGSATVLTGSSAHGQGHHTSFAMIASDTTGIPFDRIEVRHGDTDEVPRGGGTGGSKSLQVGGSAVRGAAIEAVERGRQLAADLLEANPDDITLDVTTGRFHVAGTPAVDVGWGEVATKAMADAEPDPDSVEVRGLKTEHDFQPGGATFPFGAHIAVVDVDPATGEVTLVRHVAVDDAGTIINPMLVDGQVHGGLAQGIAQALIEEFVYDDAGNPLTSNFMDYGIPAATELPTFERFPNVTPTPHNPLGAKGIGESGTIGATPAVQNAVVDALAHLGVTHVDIPTTPERVWRAMQRSG